MLFNQINIYGWDDIEPVILAALVSDLPVLLIGDIGSNKTEGSEAISRAVLGAKIDFRAYEVPTLNFDDLIGFMNPKSLARGELDFVHTPLSIWKADAVLFDEINRANPFIQSKLHELIRRRRLLGLTTNIKILFSAVNPPERYQSGYMDMALASRFACVQVPNITSMKEADVNQILSGNGNGHKRIDLKAVVDKARRCRIGEDEMGKVHHLCRKVIRDLSDHQILFNARQLKMMIRLIGAGLALRYASGLDTFCDPDALTSYILSVIPETQGIVRTNLNQGMIKGTIRSLVSGFTLGDAITLARNMEELCDVDITDSLAWVSAMKQAAKYEDDPEVLKRSIAKIKSLGGKEVIENELACNLVKYLSIQFVLKTLINEDAPATRIYSRVKEIVASI